LPILAYGFPYTTTEGRSYMKGLQKVLALQ